MPTVSERLTYRGNASVAESLRDSLAMPTVSERLTYRGSALGSRVSPRLARDADSLGVTDLPWETHTVAESLRDSLAMPTVSERLTYRGNALGRRSDLPETT